jgi:hypothetical protein
MANPVNTACAHQTVVKVVDNKTTADIHVKEGAKKYYHTYVVTGDPEPTAPDPATNPDLDTTGLWVEMDTYHQFRPSAASDMYIWCTGPDADLAGRVRVDT